MEFSQLEALAGYLRVQEAMPGDIVVAEGDRASFLCWITAGRVEVPKRCDGGTPHALSTLGRVSTTSSLGHRRLTGARV